MVQSSARSSSTIHWRNLAVCGHAAAGKTTLINRLLADASRRGDNPAIPNHFTCDCEPEEKSHGHTIESSVVSFEVDGDGFNFIDTPGYSDFVGAMIGGLAVADVAIVCISARDGIQVSTRRAIQEAEKARLPILIVVTKLDDPQADFKRVVEECRSTWGAHLLPVQIPIGQGSELQRIASVVKLPDEARGAVMNLAHAHEQLVEKLVETDETLMLQYFDGVMPDASKLTELLREAIRDRDVTPILAVSVANDIGVDELMAAIAEATPRASELCRTAKTSDDDEVAIAGTTEGPLIGQVFKVHIDPFVGRVSYVRLFNGCLSKDDTVHVTGMRKDVKVSVPQLVCGDRLTPLDRAVAGQIVALTKMDDLRLGASIGCFELPPIEFPQPMVGIAISPSKLGDETKLAVALHKLAEEDPTLRLNHDSQTGEWILSGMSELHLQILRERMLRRDKVEIESHDPHIPYRETVTQSAEGSYRHKKQSGGRGQFGEVHLRVMPLPRGTDVEVFATKERFASMKSYQYHKEHHFLWVDSIVGGSIPGNFMPAVEKGLLECLAQGVLAGFPIQDIAVEVFFGKHHPVDSCETAFRIAAHHALREVFADARPALLEPVAKLTVTCPDEAVGDIYGDMSSRGGRVLGTDTVAGGMQSIACEVPLRCISHYDRTLSSATGGQGTYTLELSHYEVVPREVAAEIVRESRREFAGTHS